MDSHHAQSVTPPVPDDEGAGPSSEPEAAASPAADTVRTAARAVVLVVPLIPALAMPWFAPRGVAVAWMCLVGVLTMAAAIAPAGRGTSSGSVIGVIPLATVALVGVTSVVGMAAAAVGWRIWASPLGAQVTWTVLMVAVGAVAVIRGGRVRVIGRDIAAGVAAIALWGLGVAVAATIPFELWARNTSGGTDFGRHILLMRSVADDGFLSYGSLGYPRALHSLVALAWQSGGDTAYAGAWRALESVLWLVLVMLFTAALLAATRLAQRLRLWWALGHIVIPLLVVAILLQGMWLGAMFTNGFVTSCMAGLTISVLMASGLQERSLGSFGAVLVACLAIVVMVQSWILLVAVVAAPGLVAVVAHLRARPRRWSRYAWTAGAVLVTALICLPVLATTLREQASDRDLVEALTTYGVSGLSQPGWWWLVALVLALGCAGGCWRRRQLRGSVLWWLAMVAAAAVSVCALQLIADGSWTIASYYPLKAMWTCSVLVVPFAVVGGAWFVETLTRRAAGLANRAARLASVAAVLGCTFLIFVAVLGWEVGYPSIVRLAMFHGISTVPVQIPFISSMEAAGMKGDDEHVIVWGSSPHAVLGAMDWTAGYPDWYSGEATQWLGYKGVPDRMAAALLNRDVGTACEFLRTYPEAKRLTGPNEVAGASWLIDGGCPEEVVRPDEWLSFAVPETWFQETRAYNTPYDAYPTFAEWQAWRNRASG